MDFGVSRIHETTCATISRAKEERASCFYVASSSGAKEERASCFYVASSSADCRDWGDRAGLKVCSPRDPGPRRSG